MVTNLLVEGYSHLLGSAIESTAVVVVNSGVVLSVVSATGGVGKRAKSMRLILHK